LASVSVWTRALTVGFSGVSGGVGKCAAMDRGGVFGGWNSMACACENLMGALKSVAWKAWGELEV